MGKLAKIVKLVELFNHRKWVTLETIMMVCEVPERTAYRYLNTISEADIPIYFDRQRRAYSLTRRSSRAGGLGLADALLCMAALAELGQRVNLHYRRQAEDLALRLAVMQPEGVDQLRRGWEGGLNRADSVAGRSSQLTELLLRAAILCERPVRLLLQPDAEEFVEVEIRRPRMLHRTTWRVIDGESEGDETEQGAIAIDEIEKVSIR